MLVIDVLGRKAAGTWPSKPRAPKPGSIKRLSNYPKLRIKVDETRACCDVVGEKVEEMAVDNSAPKVVDSKVSVTVLPGSFAAQVAAGAAKVGEFMPAPLPTNNPWVIKAVEATFDRVVAIDGAAPEAQGELASVKPANEGESVGAAVDEAAALEVVIPEPATQIEVAGEANCQPFRVCSSEFNCYQPRGVKDAHRANVLIDYIAESPALFRVIAADMGLTSEELITGLVVAPDSELEALDEILWSGYYQDKLFGQRHEEVAVPPKAEVKAEIQQLAGNVAELTAVVAAGAALSKGNKRGGAKVKARQAKAAARAAQALESAKEALAAELAKAATTSLAADLVDAIAQGVDMREPLESPEDAAVRATQELGFSDKRGKAQRRAQKQPLYMADQREVGVFGELDETRTVVASESNRLKKCMLPKPGNKKVLSELIAFLMEKVSYTKRSPNDLKWIRGIALNWFNQFDWVTNGWTSESKLSLIHIAIRAVIRETSEERVAFYAATGSDAKRTVSHWADGKPSGTLDSIRGVWSRWVGKASAKACANPKGF